MEVSIRDAAAVIGGDVRLVCRVCQKQFAKYTCPRCNLRSCSLPCYKSHGTQCTEGFYRESAVKELQGLKADKAERQRMLETLQRLHMAEQDELMDQDEQSDEDEDEGDGTRGGLSEETIRKLSSGDGDVSLDLLTPGERRAFQRAVASGELSRLIDPWQPWWDRPAAKTLNIGRHGTGLILEPGPSRPTEQEMQPSPFAEEGLSGEADRGGGGIPRPPAEAVPPLQSLTSAPPSPLLAVHLADVLYGYCFALRLYNGDWRGDPVGAAGALVGVSGVLSQSAAPETVEGALGECLQRVCSPEWRDSGGAAFGVALMEDLSTLVGLGRPAVICALADSQRLMESAVVEARPSRQPEGNGTMAVLAKGLHKRLPSGSVPVSSSVSKDRTSTIEACSPIAGSPADPDRSPGHDRGASQGLGRGRGSRLRNKDTLRNKGEAQLSSTRRLQLVGLKLRFFLSWANEQLPLVFTGLAAMVLAFHDHQREIVAQQQRGLAARQPIVGNLADDTKDTKKGKIQEVL